jgi:hypothetical protein
VDGTLQRLAQSDVPAWIMGEIEGGEREVRIE